MDVVLDQISDFKCNMNIITEEVRMAQHKYENHVEGRISIFEETLNSFIKESLIRQKNSENMVWEIKKNYDQTFKAQASSIKKIESHLGKITELIQDRETGSLPSTTKTNPRGLAHAITTRSGLSYKPPKNPLENNSQIEPLAEDTSTRNDGKEPNKPRNTAKPYAQPIPFPGRLKKEKEKVQFRKFLKNLQQLIINIPFIEALEQMPKYVKFMKDLLYKKGRMEETSRITLNEKCFAILLNEIPLKKKDPGSFTIPRIIGKVGINKALADLRASISLMPYSMFTRLVLGELKPTRVCIELANKLTQYPRGIAENVIVKIDKFVFPVDFVVLDMEEDHKIPIILWRPFLATAHAMIDVFNKKISFKLGNETVTFDIEKSMRFASPEDDTYRDDEADQSADTEVLSKHKAALAWKVADIKGISPLFCTHKILMEDNFKPIVQPQRRLNPKVQDVVKAEIVTLLDVGLIYAISDSPWVSPIHAVPKKGGMTVITNENNKLVPTRTVTR
ncbi:DNA-directed DNA polymerase [Tanacetum coccineum]